MDRKDYFLIILVLGSLWGFFEMIALPVWILCALGLKKIRLMTNNPRKIVGLEGYCLKIVERIPIICPANKYSERYLRTKKEKLGHIL